jgi:hypothetical protein
MTTNYEAEQGQKLFGFGVLWFTSSSYTLVAFNYFPQRISRAEIVMSALLAAYGILLWRSAFRKLSLANCIIVLSCASVLVLWAFKMYEGFHFSNRQRSLMADLGVSAIGLTIGACTAVFGAWWADSTYMRARFHR